MITISTDIAGTPVSGFGFIAEISFVLFQKEGGGIYRQSPVCPATATAV